MKNKIIYTLQRVLGFQNYLYTFSVFKILTFKADKKENEFQYFMDMLPDKGAVLDIGANIGLMTIKLAQQLPNAQVFSFEPMPDNYATLERIKSLFQAKNVHTFPVALGEQDGAKKSKNSSFL